jgi:hypothetical protein
MNSYLSEAEKKEILAVYLDYKTRGWPEKFRNAQEATRAYFEERFPDLTTARIIGIQGGATRAANWKARAANRAATVLGCSRHSGIGKRFKESLFKLALSHAVTTGWASRASFMRALGMNALEAKTAMRMLSDADCVGKPFGHFGCPITEKAGPENERLALEDRNEGQTITVASKPMPTYTRTATSRLRIVDISDMVAAGTDVVLWNGQTLCRAGVDVAIVKLLPTGK